MSAVEISYAGAIDQGIGRDLGIGSCGIHLLGGVQLNGSHSTAAVAEVLCLRPSRPADQPSLLEKSTVEVGPAAAVFVYKHKSSCWTRLPTSELSAKHLDVWRSHAALPRARVSTIRPWIFFIVSRDCQILLSVWPRFPIQESRIESVGEGHGGLWSTNVCSP